MTPPDAAPKIPTPTDPGGPETVKVRYPNDMDSELRQAVRVLAMAARALETAGGELTLPQYRVLALVASSPDRASRIAELASVSRPSLTGLLDGLEAKGLVRRHDVAGDRRGVHLIVTDAGHASLAATEEVMAGKLGRMLGCVSPRARSQVLSGTKALGQALEVHHHVLREAAVRDAAMRGPALPL